MDADVHWPNGWEGGYVEGHDEVRDYLTRQWKELHVYLGRYACFLAFLTSVKKI
jgi:hypothetical protein